VYQEVKQGAQAPAVVWMKGQVENRKEGMVAHIFIKDLYKALTSADKTKVRREQKESVQSDLSQQMETKGLV
jgi:hypothetical protein